VVDCSRQMVRQHGSCVDRSAFLSFKCRGHGHYVPSFGTQSVCGFKIFCFL